MSADQGWRELFFDAFRGSRNPMVLLDTQRRHVEVNGAYLQLLGYSRQVLLGRPVYELVVGGPLQTEPEWQQTLRQDQFDGRADLRCADGGRVTVEFAGHPANVPGAALVLFVVMRAGRGGRLRREPTSATGGSMPLSPRELQVVGLIADGYTGREIATELQLATHTINSHVRNAMTKLDARSRAQMVAKVMGNGVWPPRD